ncbi:hypothetical protein KPATCC21470_1723 [Kitasatospora purpeofusca]
MVETNCDRNRCGVSVTVQVTGSPDRLTIIFRTVLALSGT